MKKNNFKKLSGFTLIELMVVVSIIAMLSAVAVIGLTQVRQKASDTSSLSSIREIQIALEAYKSVNSYYPYNGTQGSITVAGSCLTGLVPSFMTSLPKANNQSATTGFLYYVSADHKSYCITARGNVFYPTSQTELVDPARTNTWLTCAGPLASTHTFLQ